MFFSAQAHKLDNDSGEASKPAPSASTAASAPVAPAALDTASTPYLIMQQQQRDSALSKRQHSGVMGSFFMVRLHAWYYPLVRLVD
jgi:hypothetical protein